MDSIALDDNELEIVQAYATKMGLSLDDAAQQLFEKGLSAKLAAVAPSTMAIRKILRDSKGAFDAKS